MVTQPIKPNLNPSCTADWRWKRVQSLIQHNKHPDKYDDEPIRRLFRFLTQVNPDSASKSDAIPQPGIPAAYHLYISQTLLRDEIEARLLAGKSEEAIAAKTGIDTTTLDDYITCFFDIRGRLQACDWIMNSALHFYGWNPEEISIGQIWRWAAFAGGLSGLSTLEAMIEEHSQQSPDNATGSLTAKARALIRLHRTPACSPTSAKVLREADRAFGDTNVKANIEILSQSRASLIPDPPPQAIRKPVRQRKPGSKNKPARNTSNTGIATPTQQAHPVTTAATN